MKNELTLSIGELVLLKYTTLLSSELVANLYIPLDGGTKYAVSLPNNLLVGFSNDGLLTQEAKSV